MKKIDPKYATFEQAKWLKEKGFDEQCTALFIHEIRQGNTEWEILEFFERNNDDTYEFLLSCDMDWQKNYLRPEQHQVVEWLRLNHGIDLYHITYKGTKGKYDCIVVCDKFRTEMSTMLLTHSRWFNSPQEAYSAAFDYIKDNNLI